MKMKGLLLLTAAMLTTMIIMVGCKKKEQPAPPPPAEPNKTEASAAVETEQTMCPVMDGMKINPNVFVEYKGKKVYFCCNDCKGKFEADPEKYTANLPQFKK